MFFFHVFAAVSTTVRWTSAALALVLHMADEFQEVAGYCEKMDGNADGKWMNSVKLNNADFEFVGFLSLYLKDESHMT